MMTYPRAFFRLGVWVGLVTVTLCAGLVGPAITLTPAFAQAGGQSLTVGEAVTGTLDGKDFMQVYSLSGTAGDTVTIDVTTDVEALAPVVMVTDQRGNVIVQDADLATPTTASIADLKLPDTGTYYIIVMRGSGAQGDASGKFTLKLSGVQQVGGQAITLDNGGIMFELGWNAAVDLNLEVRDPAGGSVQRFHTGVPSGGVLDADVNSSCEGATANSPTETIAWPAGQVPVGSYEIIVYYTDGCNVGGPQMFTLKVTVNGETPQTLTGTLNPGQQYLSRMVLSTDGGWNLVNGGVNAGLDISVLRTEIASASSIAIGSTVSGLITNGVPAQAYTFEADANTAITIDMQAQSGSLDPYLVLLGPDNTPLANNDDVDTTTTNAGISRTLATSGTYTIIATRYGLTIGGTEGEYTLSLNTAQTATATTTAGGSTTAGVTTTPAATPLPQGAIEIKLQWTTNADLQLLVRDPSGETVYDDIPITKSGGVLATAGNMGCRDLTTSPVSYVYWPPNRLLPGIYEIEVWYQNTCGDSTPVNFGLSATVQGQTVINTTQNANPDNHYMITFNVQSDGTVIAGPGGFFDMKTANTLNYQAALSTATAISYGQKVSGSITQQQPFVVYSFDGQQGDVVTVSMNATGGTLDPTLYLISPEGIQVAFNDDVAPGENSNSVIDKVTLASSGTYYIIATHYGLNLGGTQGTYQLTLVQD
jgi:hypothetical protein